VGLFYHLELFLHYHVSIEGLALSFAGVLGLAL
jgi:hypothetical protein